VSTSHAYDWEQDFLIIGVPPLERLTIFDNYKDTEYFKTNIDVDDWTQTQEKTQYHHGLKNKKVEEFKDFTLVEDRAWTETCALRNIFLLTEWLDKNCASYLVVNLSKPFDANNHWGPSEFVLPYCTNHNKCILFKDTYYSINLYRNKPPDFDPHKWMGHHGSAGNKCFFEESILPALEKEKNC